MSDLSPKDIALLESQVPVGILVQSDETMRLVHIRGDVVAAHVGSSVESVTTEDGLVFWFDTATELLAVKRMATLNLRAVADFSSRTVPLLRGTVLITGLRAGNPDGLTLDQMTALLNEPEPPWLANWILHTRVEGDRQRRRRRR